MQTVDITSRSRRRDENNARRNTMRKGRINEKEIKQKREWNHEYRQRDEEETRYGDRVASH